MLSFGKLSRSVLKMFLRLFPFILLNAMFVIEMRFPGWQRENVLTLLTEKEKRFANISILILDQDEESTQQLVNIYSVYINSIFI